MLQGIRQWARQFKQDIVTVYLLARHPETPFWLKLLAWIIAGYALSPIDLIPDFVPILGYVDDLLLLPAGLWLVLHLAPQPLLLECREQAKQWASRTVSRWAAVVIVLLWLCLALVAWYGW